MTLSLGLICIGAAALVAMRRFSPLLRTSLIGAAMAAIALYLFLRGLSPLSAASPALRDATGIVPGLLGLWWLLAARLLVEAVKRVAVGGPDRHRAKLFSDLVAVGIYITALFGVLSSVLHIPIGGVLATSGVIAIVLGLALQNTLADVFSGIAVGAERTFTVGDRVSIADDLEGEVVDATWRSVRIRTDSDDLATLPNSLVAKARIVNRSVPSTRRASSVEIGCSSCVRPALVMEQLRYAAMLCPDLLADPAPAVRLLHLGVRRSTYGVFFRVASTPRLAPAKSDLLCNIHRMFFYAGISTGEVNAGEGTASFTASHLSGRQLLDSVELFTATPDEQRDRLATTLSLRHLVTGEVLFAQGDAHPALHLIASGVFEVHHQTDSGDQRILGRVGPGDSVGEIGAMTGEPYAATATALSPGVVYSLPKAALTALFAENKSMVAPLEQAVREDTALIDQSTAASIARPAVGRLHRLAEYLRGRLHF